MVNKTYIPFTNKEIILFNKDLKYSLHHKHWISNLALEAEAALPLLPTPEQEHIKYDSPQPQQVIQAAQKSTLFQFHQRQIQDH